MFQDTFQGPGAGTYANHTIEILLMLLVAFLLGALLGYIIWYRYRRMHKELQAEHDRLRTLHTELEKDHASLRYKHDELEKQLTESRARVRSLDADVAILKNKLQKTEAELAAATSMDATAAGITGAATTPPPVPDDLKQVEGVGPKIEKLLNDNGIWTYQQLSHADPAHLKKMLDEAGPQYRMADPATWPKQAELAAEAKWDELKEYQKLLFGGKNLEEI